MLYIKSDLRVAKKEHRLQFDCQCFSLLLHKTIDLKSNGEKICSRK